MAIKRSGIAASVVAVLCVVLMLAGMASAKVAISHRPARRSLSQIEPAAEVARMALELEQATDAVPPPPPPPPPPPVDLAPRADGEFSPKVEGTSTVTIHNAYRAVHGSPALKRSTTLVNTAKAWASELASTCTFEHSNTQYGENLAAGYSNWADAIWGWYVEYKDYDYSNPVFGLDTGHFTQVVWKSTARIGCAVARNDACPDYQTFYVCNYDPPGNYEGQFEANVPEPL